MATNPPEFIQPPEEQPEPEPSPWERWQEAGIDPEYDPRMAREAIAYHETLRDREHSPRAIEQLLQQRGYLPEGMSLQEFSEMARQAAQTDPWEALNAPQEPYGYHPQTGQPLYEGGYDQPQQQGLDPRALQSAIDAEIERRFAARDQADYDRRQQEAVEQEFRGELDRVEREHDLTPIEKQAIAGWAVQMKTNMPTYSTAEVVDRAAAEYQKVIEKKLQALATQQTVGAPQTGMAPTGPPPSTEQVAGSMEEANQRLQDFFKG